MTEAADSLTSEVSAPPKRIASRRGGAFLAVAATGIATQGVTALSGPLVARMLGPYGRGQMVLVLLVALMTSQLAVGGLPAAIAHEVSRAGLPARDVVHSELRRWLRLSPLPGVAGAIALALLLHGSASDWPAFALLGFALTTAYIWQLVLYGMVQGERNVTNLNIYHMTGLSLYAIVVLVIFVASPTREPLLLIGLFIACIAIGLCVGWAMLRSPSGTPGERVDVSALLTFARRSYVSGVGLLDGLGLDVLLAGIIFGEAKVGEYAVAVSATNVTTIVLSGIAQVLLPRLAAAPSPAAAGATLRRWGLASLGVAVLFVLGIELIIGPVMQFAFGPKFVGIIGCARILVVSWAFLGSRRVLTAVLQSQGRAAYASKVEMACLALMLTGVVTLGLTIGLNGLAYSVGGAGLMSCVCLALAIEWRPSPETVLSAAAAGTVAPESLAADIGGL